jgi:hypothetical protein
MADAYLATVHILVPAEVVESQAGMCDWMSGLLSENEQVVDWSYAHDSSGVREPEHVVLADPYEEGDFLPLVRG